MARIVVFIDESGNPFQDEYTFSSGAVWCAVERSEGREKPLESTIDSIRQYLRESGKARWAREIHHLDLPDDCAEYLLFLAIERSRYDRTIIRDESFFKISPIAFTYNADNPRAIKILNPGMDERMLGNTCRLNALGNLLRPLCGYRGEASLYVDIILDSEVWRSCIERYDPLLRNTINNARICQRIYCSRSKKTPGLQIADIVAGINRQYTMNSRQIIGFRLLQAHALNRINPIR